MFDAASDPGGTAAGGGAAAGLDAAGVGAWQRALSAHVETLSPATDGPRRDEAGLPDDAELVDLLRACEELKATAEAAQAAASVALDASQRAAAATRGVPAARQGRGVAAQVGLARRVSHHRATRLLGLAKIAATELPHASAAWRAGLVSEWRMTLLARETAALPVQHRLEVDRTLAGDPARLAAMGDRDLIAQARRLAQRLDPGAIAARRRKAESQRGVSCRPGPDTMAYLTGHVPAAQGIAAHVALTKHADALRSAGDPRSRSQIMADTLIDRVLHPGTTATGSYDPTRWDATPPETPGKPPSPPIRINLVMTDHTLLRQGNEPGWLADYGPIPADLARDLATSANLDDDSATFLRRLFTDPTTGQLVAMESTQRAFPKRLAEFIRLRDTHRCRTPWCDAPIRHTDHAKPHDAGGTTTAQNGQGLCEACNHAKQATGWRVHPVRGPDDTHTIQTTTPTNHTYTSHAPTTTHPHHPRWRIDFTFPIAA